MRLTLRYLRIAVTVLSLTACVLLVAMWVRSYWWMDTVVVGGALHLFLAQGMLLFDWFPVGSDRWIYWTVPADSINVAKEIEGVGFSFVFGVGYKFYGDGLSVVFQFWVPLLLAASLAIIPWIHLAKRFSLRTLLIAMTLVAVVLGVIVYAAR